jgi:hypothetical protein
VLFPLVQQLVLTVFPHGGQGRARRNAWAGKVSDASLARNRREALVALAAAQGRATRAQRAQ